jgi:hypothetical protein
MDKPPSERQHGGIATSRFFVKVQRAVLPDKGWIWEHWEEGGIAAIARSRIKHQCAEDAFIAGRKALPS